jgi:hypothetical protein
VKLIRELAADPDRVEVYRTAKYDFMARTLTVDDVCEAICDWIDCGQPVNETVIHTIPELKDTPAYELKPVLFEKRYYVKLGLERRGDDWLLILSAHLDM